MMNENDLTSIGIDLQTLTNEQVIRVSNAERSCRNAKTNWSKEYWHETFKKLCKEYNVMSYYSKMTIGS